MALTPRRRSSISCFKRQLLWFHAAGSITCLSLVPSFDVFQKCPPYLGGVGPGELATNQIGTTFHGRNET